MQKQSPKDDCLCAQSCLVGLESLSNPLHPMFDVPTSKPSKGLFAIVLRFEEIPKSVFHQSLVIGSRVVPDKKLTTITTTIMYV